MAIYVTEIALISRVYKNSRSQEEKRNKAIKPSGKKTTNDSQVCDNNSHCLSERALDLE